LSQQVNPKSRSRSQLKNSQPSQLNGIPTKENKSKGRDQGTPFLLSMCHGPSSLVGTKPSSLWCHQWKDGDVCVDVSVWGVGWWLGRLWCDDVEGYR